MMGMQEKLEKKLSIGILAIILLVCCLTVTTFALIYASVNLENNWIETGRVGVNLNDGNPVISQGEFLYEPGARVEKSFFLKNTGSCDVWYRFYFENISGNLKDVLQVTIKDGETVLYTGTVVELNSGYAQSAPANEIALVQGEQRTFTIQFYFPKEAGNAVQGASLLFDLKADAVQTQNNPNRLFND